MIVLFTNVTQRFVEALAVTMRGVALALVLVAATLASSGRASLHVDLSALVRPLPESVSEWTPIDVETWVNRTLGYPEYSSIVREHLIDGPTLVMLDVEKTFAPKYHVHGVKFRAHIDIHFRSVAQTAETPKKSAVLLVILPSLGLCPRLVLNHPSVQGTLMNPLV